MITALLTRTLRINGETVGAANQQIVAGLLAAIDETIPANSADLEVGLQLDVSQLAALVMVATVDMTVKTNDGVAPDNTFVLKANIPFAWSSADGGALHDTNGTAVASDVLALFVSSLTEGTLKIRALRHPPV
jgi:hypothetical protein